MAGSVTLFFYNVIVSMEKLEYYCDEKRHLICKPYTIENLHRMAEELGINRVWFHNKGILSHYDIPMQRLLEIKSKCTIVNHRQIIDIIRGKIT